MINSTDVTMLKVLLIDDDREFCKLLCEYMQNNAFKLIFVNTGSKGLQMLFNGGFDLVILDMFLPDMNGSEVLKKIRAESNIPVIILSAHDEETEIIVNLELGADDYVSKDASSRTLLARIRAVMRRRRISQNPLSDSENTSGEQISSLRGILMNYATREAFLEGSLLELSRAEFDLLYPMISQPGRIFSRDELLAAIDDEFSEKTDRLIDVYIYSLRNKLSDDSKKPKYIRTFHGSGYSVIR